MEFKLGWSLLVSRLGRAVKRARSQRGLGGYTPDASLWNTVWWMSHLQAALLN